MSDNNLNRGTDDAESGAGGSGSGLTTNPVAGTPPDADSLDDAPDTIKPTLDDTGRYTGAANDPGYDSVRSTGGAIDREPGA